MSNYGFVVMWSEEDQGYIVSCPDFPGLSAFGETPEEALSEAQVALGLFVQSFAESGQTLPEVTMAQEYSGQIRVRMPKTLHKNLAENAEYEGVSLNTFIVTLLSERNIATALIEKVCSRIDNVANAVNTHRAETRQLSKTARYTLDYEQGDEYGKVEYSIN